MGGSWVDVRLAHKRRAHHIVAQRTLNIRAKASTLAVEAVARGSVRMGALEGYHNLISSRRAALLVPPAD